MLGFIGIKWLSQKVPIKWVPESSRTVPINPTSFSQGSSPRNILKTKKAEETISGHFAGAILPSENEEFRRTLLPFIEPSF